MTPASYCPDCGPATVVHWTERWSAIFDWLFTPVTVPFGAVGRAVQPLLHYCGLQYVLAAVLRTLAALHLGTITYELDDKDNLRTKALWESAKKRGIVMWQFRLFGNPNIDFLFARSGKRFIYFDGLPRPGIRSSAALDWMDDKGILKKKLAAAGIPVAPGEACTSLRHALTVFRELGAPVIAKPSVGSRSRHTTVGIKDEAQLAEAFKKAKQLSPWVIVERELQGPVFRATIIGGKVGGIISRDFPHVVGDGHSTVRELLERENANPARHGPIFHEIPTGPDADAELALQGLDWESVPAAGRSVQLNPKASRSFGASTTDATDIAHPDNVAMFEAVGRVLRDPVVGIDFMIRDMAKSWREQDACGVIECNSLPFVDLHHYPLFGTPRDVAGMLWDLVFPPASASIGA